MNGVSTGTFPTRFLRDDGRRTATSNERFLLSLLRKGGPQSRIELSRASGLTAQSITRLVEPLIARGLLLEDAPVVLGRGKPAAPLHLNGKAAFGAGVSLMTDALALALVDLEGTVLLRLTEPLSSLRREAGLRQIQALVDRAIAMAHLDRERMVGVGVAITGYFIGEGAKVNPPLPLDDWAFQPIDRHLHQALGVPVWVENDGSAAAIGEAVLGAGRRARNFAYLYFSAGFGGGVIVDGALARGSHGNAGEFASVIPEGGFQPTLHNLMQIIREEGSDYADLNALLADFDPAHPGVLAWIEKAVPSLDLVISAISAALDPDLIVLGGRLPPVLAGRLIPRLSFTNPLRRGRNRPVPGIVPSAITGDASAIGAATLPIEAAFFEAHRLWQKGIDPEEKIPEQVTGAKSSDIDSN